MNTRQISFQGDKTAKAAHISDNNEINKAIEGMQIPHPRRVIVLVGGAGGIGWLDKFPMRKAIKIIARLADETQSVVVDGGTQAGIMTEIGQQRKRHKFSFPLIGVVFDSLLMKEEPQSVLDLITRTFSSSLAMTGGMNRPGSRRLQPRSPVTKNPLLFL
jgi:hypothetical protein